MHWWGILKLASPQLDQGAGDEQHDRDQHAPRACDQVADGAEEDQETHAPLPMGPDLTRRGLTGRC